MKKTTPVRFGSFLRRFYPLPEALLGYLFGIFAAALSVGGVISVYKPLPLREALPEALASELPFWVAAALLALIRPVLNGGRLLVFLKTACCGYGAELISRGSYPSLGYFQYVAVSLLIAALYTCLIRQAADSFANARLDRKADAKLKICDYLVRSLFYSGTAFLLIPLKYFTGF